MSDLIPSNGRMKTATINKSALIERTIRFQIKAGPVSPHMIHVYWMKAVQDALGSANIELISNNNERISTVDTVQWSNPYFHVQHFHIHDRTDWRNNDQTVTYYLVHRIRTSESIDMIKRIPRAFQILKEHNCYLHEHYWNETEWDCQQLGFMIGLDNRRYDQCQATEALTQKILMRIDYISRKQLPQFRLILSTPTVRHPNGVVVSTKAYAVEVQAMHSHKLKKLLETTFLGKKSYVPFKTRHSSPKAFENAIKYQNLHLSKWDSQTVAPPSPKTTFVPPDAADDDNNNIPHTTTAASPKHENSQLAQHKALVEEHKALLAEHRVRMAENEARMAENEARMAEYKAYIAENEARMAEHRAHVEENKLRMTEIREMLILLLRSTLPPVNTTISHG